ncbi:MAG: hypothetical protein ACKOPS_09330, partial [Cyanobium sp.]
MTSTLPPNNLPATANTATVAISPSPSFAPQPVAETGDEGFSLQKFLRTVRRRQRTFIATLVLVSAASTAWLAYQRIVNPVYQGAFGLLVTDPVSPTTSGGSGSSGTMGTQGNSGASSTIGAVALNRSLLDISTLMRVLESPTVLEPVFAQLRRQWPDERMPEITVQQYTANRGGQLAGAGILSVQVTGNNPAILTNALEQARDTFLQWSLKQRRERLQQAVTFLGEQAPELEAKANRIQRQLQ